MHLDRAVALIAISLGLAACGRDSAAPKAQLTPSEARDLAFSMAGVSSGYAGTAASGRADVVSTEGVPLHFTFSGEFPCPAGGTIAPNVTVTGDWDMQARTMTLDMAGTETMSSCAHGVEGKTMTLNGSLEFGSHTALAAGRPTGAQTFHEKGSFDWTRGDGTSGTCAIDFTATTDFTAKTRALTGTFCGRPLNYTGTLK